MEVFVGVERGDSHATFNSYMAAIKRQTLIYYCFSIQPLDVVVYIVFGQPAYILFVFVH